MPIDAGSLHYAVGPVIAAVMVAVIALFLRWAFDSGRSGGSNRDKSATDGLLTPVATVTRRESALALRAVLSDAGIRSTLRQPAPHRTDVLVFSEDAERARELALSFRGS
ncbi:hypothetical protein [Modestobacter lapidis]|nr:hypothetical protein [Modestobacter lapidis]